MTRKYEMIRNLLADPLERKILLGLMNQQEFVGKLQNTLKTENFKIFTVSLHKNESNWTLKKYA